MQLHRRRHRLHPGRHTDRGRVRWPRCRRRGSRTPGSACGSPGPVPAMGTVSVQVTGQGGVPATGVSAVVVNVTAVAPHARPGTSRCGRPGTARPQTSNLNFQAGQNIPNTGRRPGRHGREDPAVQRLHGTVHLIVDVTGYTLAGAPAQRRGLGLGRGDQRSAGQRQHRGQPGAGTGVRAQRRHRHRRRRSTPCTRCAATAPSGPGVTARRPAGQRRATGSPVPVQVSGLTDVTAIAGGCVTGYALRGDGTVWAWGAGSSGNWATAAPPTARCRCRCPG